MTEPMWRRYLRFFGPNVRSDVDDELAFHLDERIEELRSQGLDPEAARSRALAEFGDLSAVRATISRLDEQVARRRRGRAGIVTSVGAVWMDLRFAIRSLWANPGLALAAAGSLGLAIAVNVTMFGGVDVFAFHPFSVPEQSLIRVGWTSRPTTQLEFSEWREQAKTVELAANQSVGFNWADGGQAQRLNGAAVTAGYLALHGVPMLAGREFLRADETSDVPVALIGERLWRDRYASADVIGRAMLLDGQPHTIVGVVPGRYSFPRIDAPDVWVPVADGRGASGQRWVWILGRPRHGSAISAVEAEMAAIARRQADHTTEPGRRFEIRIETAVHAVVSPDARRAAWALVVGVSLVLLIACANVANLLLARTTGRGREISIRSAVGASRGRIARLLLIESAVLGALGGMVGLLLSTLGLAWLRRTVGPNELGDLPPFILSARVLWYGLAVTTAAALLFGLVPAFRRDGDLAGRLRDGGRSATGGRRGRRLQSALIAGELALSVVLLTVAGLTVRAGHRMAGVGLGIDEGRGVTFATFLPNREYPDPASMLGFQERLSERLRAIPGVAMIGIGSTLPLEGSSGTTYSVDGEVPVPGADPLSASAHVVSAGYFPAFGIEVRRGRSFEASDRLGGAPVVLVNERLAALHWAGTDPVGHQVRFRDQNWTIVGVVADVREWGVHNGPPPAIYLSAAQNPTPSIRVVVRSDRPLEQLGPEVRAAVAAVSPHQPVANLLSLTVHAERGRREPRVLSELFSLLGAVAITLAVMGVYSVTSYLIAQRTMEIGVRRALGAGRREIVGVVIRTGAKALIAGGVIGLALALAAGKGLGAALSLYRTDSFDLIVLIGVVSILVGATAAAMFAPARRALRVDPLVILRRE